MAIISTILFLSLGIYLITLLVYFTGLFFPRKGKNRDRNFLSVVIAMKNEATNLPQLLTSLLEQDYPDEDMEVILVDNESSDDSVRIARDFMGKKANFRLLSTRGKDSPYSYKKAALDLGIKNARGDIIVTTDADCLVQRTWLSGINSYFDRDTDVVVGFSEIADRANPFEKLQALDYLMLMSAAQGTLNLGFAWACSGQNLAYRKSLFNRVGGFSKVVDRIGGDDSLLLHVMKKQAKGRIVFASDSCTWVKTVAEPSLGRFISQRARWASEAEYTHKLDFKFFVIVVATFFANLAPLFFLCTTFLGMPFVREFIITFGAKFLGEGILMMKATGIYRRKDLRNLFPLWFFLQMPYIILMGLLSFVGNALPWKGERKKALKRNKGNKEIRL